MYFSVTAIVAAAFSISASATLSHIENTRRHIVRLKPGISVHSFLKVTNITTTHHWDISNGFASELSDQELGTLRSHDSVASISEDGIVHTAATTTQTNAPWGLAQLSSIKSIAADCPSDLNFSYTYNDTSGQGVDVYVVDTGVYTDHVEFGGRARWGVTFGNYSSNDRNGHGTHCAGIVAGSRFGVAKAANIISVNVLDDHGNGSVADIISGLVWIRQEVLYKTRRPSVVLLPFSVLGNSTLDNAVTALFYYGIHVIAAAGPGPDANIYSPSRVSTAITVGSSDIYGSRNDGLGSGIDLFAPGKDIVSAGTSSSRACHSLTGTSMGAAHVAGIVASLISSNGNTSPGNMQYKVKQLALKGVLTNVPNGTINALAQNGLITV